VTVAPLLSSISTAPNLRPRAGVGRLDPRWPAGALDLPRPGLARVDLW